MDMISTFSPICTTNLTCLLGGVHFSSPPGAEGLSERSVCLYMHGRALSWLPSFRGITAWTILVFVMGIGIAVLKYKYFYRFRFVHVGEFNEHRVEVEQWCVSLECVEVQVCGDLKLNLNMNR